MASGARATNGRVGILPCLVVALVGVAQEEFDPAAPRRRSALRSTGAYAGPSSTGVSRDSLTGPIPTSSPSSHGVASRSSRSVARGRWGFLDDRLVLQGVLGVGAFIDGDSQDSDYLSDDRTDEYSRSQASNHWRFHRGCGDLGRLSMDRWQDPHDAAALSRGTPAPRSAGRSVLERAATADDGRCSSAVPAGPGA